MRRGLAPMLAADALVTLLLLVTIDLDRSMRGLIEIPATPLLPPAAEGP